MSLKKIFNKLTTAAIITGTTYTLAPSVLAQSFFYPSASFFNPFAAAYQSASEDLVTILKYDEKYEILNSNLQKAELLETIEKQNLLTILAPTNEAFAALSPELKKKLSEPENLKKVLQYHLVVGNIGQEDIQRQAVATLLKQNSVEITGVNVGNKKEIKLNEAIASEPMLATDGVIIPIDKVLIPQSLENY